MSSHHSFNIGGRYTEEPRITTTRDTFKFRWCLMKNPLFAACLSVFVALVLVLPSPSTLAASTPTEETLPLEDLRLFAEIFNLIKKDYVESVDDATLLKNAVRGMLNGLDPHSAYLDADSFNEINMDNRGEFGGLGMEVTLDGGVIRVVAPLDGTPAERAGIKSGDLIIRLDGMTVKGSSLDKAIEKMRGAPGSEITLTISREGVDAPFDVTLKRAIIQLQSVRGEVLESNYGYVRVSQFQSGTGPSLRRQIEKLEEKIGNPLAGLILDLRNNPGGVLDGAVAVSDLFLKEGVIVSTRGRSGDEDFTFNATGFDVLKIGRAHV